MTQPYIRTYDSPTRFWVKATTDKDADEYLVDIVEDICTCRNFQCVQWPKRRDGAPNAASRCKHIRFARQYFLDSVLEAFKNQDNEI